MLTIAIVGMESDWCRCDNCAGPPGGRDICNKATVMNSAGTQFTIGLDCLKTLVEAKAVVKNTYLTSQDDINDACQVATFVGFAGGAERLEQDWMYVTAQKGGKTRQCYTTLLKRYAPAFLGTVPV